MAHHAAATKCRSAYVDHDDRSAAGRTGTGLSLRYYALDPGFHGASPAGRIGAGVSAGARGLVLAEGVDELGLVPRRSEEHTSELQSQSNLVCRLLLEKK